METESSRRNRRLRLMLIPVVMLLIYLLSYLMDPYNAFWICSVKGGYKEILIELFLDLALSWAIIETSMGIAHRLEKRFPWEGSSLIRFLLQTTLIIISVGVLLYLQDLMFTVIYGNINFTVQERLSIWQFFMVTILVSVMVSAVHTGYFLLERWKISMSEASDLRLKTLEFKEIAMQAELQSLKLQLDPHFMFNNFSTLAELINENTQTATLFLENLSRVYRYMIQNLKKDLVQLKDEMAFVSAFIYLIGIRHGDNVRVHIDLDNTVLTQFVPPITVQLLIENAIKHNRATAQSPLVIHIYSVDQKSITVTNNIQLITNALPSTSLGLQNIQDRYRLLASRLPEIIKTSDQFCVVIPLIEF
jgi:two-component system LytT family sensor kinase